MPPGPQTCSPSSCDTGRVRSGGHGGGPSYPGRRRAPSRRGLVARELLSSGGRCECCSRPARQWWAWGRGVGVPAGGVARVLLLSGGVVRAVLSSSWGADFWGRVRGRGPAWACERAVLRESCSCAAGRCERCCRPTRAGLTGAAGSCGVGLLVGAGHRRGVALVVRELLLSGGVVRVALSSSEAVVCVGLWRGRARWWCCARAVLVPPGGASGAVVQPGPGSPRRRARAVWAYSSASASAPRRRRSAPRTVAASVVAQNGGRDARRNPP